MINLDELKMLNSKELLEKLHGKNLETKKDVLEYIEKTKILKGEGVPQELIDDTYKLIDESIDDMKSKVKPNTIMFLKNTLKSSLGKLVKEKKENKPESGFIKFFKQAYPEGKRNRNFTYVLMDNSKISAEQIWTTLTYINRQYLKDNLTISSEEKKEIIDMIQRMLDKKDIKYVNQIKSMDKLLKMLNIKIKEEKGSFKVK